ncbi:unnamed protein product [Somion occarium]|uniref:[histone H3]-trimethyl-L-lysine(9) demethylase n=1 Tax=Somion occarium TaxID=3059160 RepID=A0ABP1D4J2_9APHY
MATPTSSTPSLTPSRSPSPEPPVQPDHFYGNDNANISSPSSDGKTWLDPADDPLAQRGIPVFKPTMEEFQDFEGYMNKIECWGMRSGIVKVIPPKEWTDALPPLTNQLAKVKLKNPIEQHMLGRGGLFRQENTEKRRIMSVREWAELCAEDDYRAPGVDDIGLHARATNGSARPRTRRSRRKGRVSETAEPAMTPDVQVKDEHEDDDEFIASISHIQDKDKSPSSSNGGAGSPDVPNDTDGRNPSEQEPNDPSVHIPAEQPPVDTLEGDEEKPKSKGGKKSGQSREAREAALAQRAALDRAFLESFDPHSDWLPPNTTQFDYTVDFCKELERQYWRNCAIVKSAWYGADMAGSLFTDETTAWNVAHLPSTLSRLLPTSSKGLPGVNTPYLYFGMWRATFAWHVEDMDLLSINYIHFGAPKYWYAVPQARAGALEQTMRGYFPKDTSQCSQFLRHKSFLASPTLLSQSSCRPNTLVQSAGEFVITYPRGYHAGFNLGFNCAESVNFALDSWLDLGRKAKACECVSFSVRINVDQLLADREAERLEAEAKEAQPAKSTKAKTSRKRKQQPTEGDQPKAKKSRMKASNPENPSSSASSSKAAQKVTLKLGPKPKEPETFPCCLCVSQSRDGLLRVHDPPLWRKEGEGGAGDVWMAHEECANVIPETWVDEIEAPAPDGSNFKEQVVFGVDAIVKDRWNLKCTACSKTKSKAHGAPIQCTKGKCPKAFHVSCARDGAALGIIYCVLREVEKEVVLLDTQLVDPPLAVHENVDAMAVDPALLSVNHNMAVDSEKFQGPLQDSREPSATVLKLIKKCEVQVLCPQHNPAIAEAKKAQKQDRIRNDLLALPPMARIKLRVSAGVFEVTLVRVIEETKSVEVLWDRGMKREFKWGSVVFGTTETVVGQKPSEPAAEPIRPPEANPPPQFAPLRGTAPTVHIRQSLHTPMSTPGAGPSQPTAPPSSYPLPPTHSAYHQHTHQPPMYPHPSHYQHHSTSTYQYAPGNWAYQYPHPSQPYSGNHTPYPQSQSPYYRPSYSSYPQYHGFSYAAPAQPGPTANIYTHTPHQQTPPQYQHPPTPQPQPQAQAEAQPQAPQQTPAQTATMRRELQWQRPYTGPKAPAHPGANISPSTETLTASQLISNSEHSSQTGTSNTVSPAPSASLTSDVSTYQVEAPALPPS